jgi:hypothetical protein
MAKNEDKSKALKKEEDMLKRIAKLVKEGEESYKKQNVYISSISNSIFGISQSDWFDKIKVSSEDISKMTSDFAEMQDVISEAAGTLNTEFSKAIEQNRGDILGMAQDLFKVNEEMSKGLVEAVQKRDFTTFLNKFGEEGEKVFKEITKDKNFTKLDDLLKGKSLKDFKKVTQEAKQLENTLKNANKETFSLQEGFKKIAANMLKSLAMGPLKESLLSFDQTITETQRDTGIAMKENTLAFSDLTMQTARFGMSVKDTSELMGKLGAGLRTTDFGVLTKAAGDMAAISKATGVSIDEIAELGSQMMLFGKTSEDVSKFAENTMKSAQNFGVNGKKIMTDIAKNLPKFRQMGFQGGEESLKRMALQAERLGQNIDEIFDVAKRARTIEGSLDMAAQLQLAGGSFSNINPMDLLAAARKGPEELQKILAKMGSDIGTFNEKTGKMDFSAVDVDRLQIAADATGMSIDSLQKQIAKSAETNQKTQLLPPGLFEGLSPEEQAFLTNSMKMKDGKLIDIGVGGIDELSGLTQENIKAKMDQANADKTTLAEQAEQNMSFQESVASLKTAVMNIFTYLEPVVKQLTKFVQYLSEKLSEFGGTTKAVIAALVGAGVILFGYAKQFASGFAFGKGQNAALQGGGFFKSIAGAIGKGKGGAGALGDVATTAKQAEGVPPGGGLKMFLTNLGEGLSKLGQNMGQVLKGAATLGLSMLLIGAPLLMALAFAGKEKALIAYGLALVEISMALWLASKAMDKLSIKGIILGSLAMGLLGLAMMPFMATLQTMEGIKWETLGKMAVAIAGAALILGVMGAGPIPGFILLGALALAGAAGALYIFGAAIQEIAGGFTLLGGINWAGFMLMGTALMSVVPGLLALGGVGLFALPGLFMMTGVLAGLAAVMVVLAPALSMASTSMIQMADGIDKLKNAVKGLDVDKLESLAGASERMATASAIGGLANAINSFVGGGSNSGGGKEQTMRLEPITINLKLNGRQMQQEIVTSTAHLS